MMHVHHVCSMHVHHVCAWQVQNVISTNTRTRTRTRTRARTRAHTNIQTNTSICCDMFLVFANLFLMFCWRLSIALDVFVDVFLILLDCLGCSLCFSGVIKKGGGKGAHRAPSAQAQGPSCSSHL